MSFAHDNPARYAQTIRRALLLPLVALAILTGLLVWQVAALTATLGKVNESSHLIATADHLQRLLIDMETGERGYLVGGSPLFLQPYQEALKAVDSTFDELDRLVSGNVIQRRQMGEIRASYVIWVQEAHREIDRHDAVATGSRGAFVAYFNQAHGEAVMDRLRNQIDTLIAEARIGRNRRSERAQAQSWQALSLAGFSTLFIGGLLTLTTRRALSDLSIQYESLLDAEQRARDYLGATLASIGDGVLVTDVRGRITTMNPIAEALTGWKQSEAAGTDSTIVFDIVNEETGAVVESPVERVLRDGIIVGLANHTILRRRDGSAIPIDDSGAPIRDRDGALTGVVLVFRDVSERKLQEAALALEAAKNSRIAETLQRSLLLTPPPNHFPGLDVAMRYQAALDEAQLGGDFFDAFALNEHQVAFVVGDVTGKGLSAASFTAEVKFALRAMLREDGDVANALVRLNRFLIGSRPLDGQNVYALIALSLAIVDRTTGDLRVAVAGAEAPLVARADRSIPAFEVTAGGSLLGIDLTSAYQESLPVRLQPGDRLILATDGITEARRGRREFLGSEGLARLMDSYPADLDANAVADALIAGVTAFAGQALRDDVCLVVVQRTAEMPAGET